MFSRRAFLQSALLLPALPELLASQAAAQTLPATAKPATDALFPGKIGGFTGRGFLCSLHPKKGNAATGKATSPEFTIEKPFITFQIGGGNHPGEACVNLVVDGKVERTATGDGTPNLSAASWDVSALTGKKAKIEVVDSTKSDERGYILVDDIRFRHQAIPKFIVVSTFSQRVKAVLSGTVVSAATTSGTLKCYALVPPTIETQKLVSCSIQCRDFPEIQAVPAKDALSPDKKYIVINIPLRADTLSRPLAIDITYIVDLYKVSLRPNANGLEVPNVPSPENTDLQATKTIDYDNPKFKAFLRANDLVKKQGETSLDFAYRAYAKLNEDLASRVRSDAPGVDPKDWKASILCQPDSHNGGCGFCSIQFAAVLRANGVPSRLMTGRWAKNTEGDYGQFHVRNDFYEPSVGWIPIDQTFGFFAKRDGANPNINFGANNADFLTMHLNSEVSPEGSGFYMPLHQFGIVAYNGNSPYNPSGKEIWTVTRINTN